MGLIFSRFKAKVSTKDVLQKIEDEINELEEYKTTTQEWQKKILRKLVLYSISLYLLAASYALLFPVTLHIRSYFYITMFLFPFIVYFSQRGLGWHYRRNIRINDSRLKELREKKQKILEHIMETETYKVAREILEVFAPEQLSKHTPLREIKPQRGEKASTPGTELRRRNTTLPCIEITSPTPLPKNMPMMTSPVLRKSVGRPLAAAQENAPTPIYRAARQVQGTSYLDDIQSTPGGRYVGNVALKPGPPMPRPLLPRERGLFVRMLDYMVGDGPSNRYALICRQCESHNGMALKEEFEFLSFRCCYCHYWNPAKKQRPLAPRLASQLPAHSHSFPDLRTSAMPLPKLEMQFTEEESDSSSDECSDELEKTVKKDEVIKPNQVPDVILPNQPAEAHVTPTEEGHKNDDKNDVSQMDFE
ncbi:endoplasmic reticulum junction formation protein lunapark-B-like [Artemia franciscana]|uniref:Endoplasmic reticulum junction formation protein lunapark n=1 Tax=Artemia franciscana TaxID=6661 RepID=A0AA88IT00_ARTSF|nr:hypothetical protein QYM36_000645 [Artemia franciscana]